MSAKCMWKKLEDSIIEQRKILHISIAEGISSINQSLWVNLWGFPGFNWIHCLYSHRKSNFRNETLQLFLLLKEVVSPIYWERDWFFNWDLHKKASEINEYLSNHRLKTIENKL